MKQYKWILLFIAIMGVVITLLRIISEEDSVIDQIQRIEIEELKRENTSLQEINDLLDSKIEILETITDSLTALIDTDRLVIEKLKRKKYEQISVIDDFTDDELYQYFTGFDTQDKGN